MIYHNMSRGLIGHDARKQCVVKQIAERPLYTRKGPLKTVDFEHSERPLLGKADIQPEACEIGSTNDRFTLGSGH